MKKLKKLASLLLAMAMVLSLSVTAFAAQEGELTGGSITINDAVENQTYKIYQILYLEGYHVDNATTGEGQYAYKANSAWERWLKTQTAYVKIDGQGYVTWVAGASAADFAKAALAYAKNNNITPDAEPVTAATTTVKFEGLKLGYYLVDSTLGTLCSLDTTNPDVIMEEKNEAPSNVKTVEEDSTGKYGEKNDGDIGQAVNFKSTITAQAGAENYVFHDTMSAGLTYTSVTGITLNGTTVDASNYNVVTTGLTDGCTFEVRFTQTFCDTLKANDQIVISYSATINENAVVGGEGNSNKSKLSYGEEGTPNMTPPSETKTYTWSVEVFKYAVENEKEIPLKGATFTLSKNADGTNPITLVSKGNNVCRVATAEDTSTVTAITTDDTGKFKVEGLDADTYYLTETAAPAGYNKLAAPVTIVIGENGVVNGTTEAPQGVDEVKVLNQTGNELPSTGGMGTTVIYIIGAILVVGAGVLLIVRRRMNAEK